MQCIFCAEEIKDAAQLCRFCGARLVDGQWRHPLSPTNDKPPGNFTLLSTGWLLVLSGVWMLLTCTSPVPLFGELRGGAVAMLYHGMGNMIDQVAVVLSLAFLACWWGLCVYIYIKRAYFLPDWGETPASR